MRALALVVAAMAFVVVAAGGTVTSTGSGDDVPTWPFPLLAFGVEMEHRHVAGLTGLLALYLGGWMLLAEDRAWVRRLGACSALLVLPQALLGGARVLLGPKPEAPAAITIAHAALGQVWFCAAVMTAVFSSRSWDRPPRRQPAAVMAASIVFVQLLLGAAIRHLGADAARVVPHVLWAVAVVAAVLWMAHRLPSSPPMIAVLALTGLQLFLGAGAFYVRQAGLDASLARALAGTGHAAVGALILALCVRLSFRRREGAGDDRPDRPTRRAELVGAP